MSYNNQYSGLVAMALILFTAGIPLAYGQIGSIFVSGLNLSGNLINSGNCSTSLAGIPVNLTCISNLGVPVLVGQNITNANGSFSINVPNFLSTPFGNLLSIIVPELNLNLNFPILQQLIQLLLRSAIPITVRIPACAVSAVSPIINQTAVCQLVPLNNVPAFLTALTNADNEIVGTVNVTMNTNAKVGN